MTTRQLKKKIACKVMKYKGTHIPTISLFSSKWLTAYKGQGVSVKIEFEPISLTKH